jgi:acyl-CoA thioester hydrolase
MIRKKDPYKECKKIAFTSYTRIRFNETDPLGIVWHGNYIKYFEDGREAFGREHGISYLDVSNHGFATPIIKSSCEHKVTVKYGETLRIETTYVDSSAAKLIFLFKLFNENNEIVCEGETIQVFVDKLGNLVLNIPDFILNWKRNVGLIE